MNIEAIAQDILDHLGIVIPSEAGHGKTFLAMALVKHFDKLGIPCYIFSPSNIWLKKFGAIDYITVGSKHYNPIMKISPKLTLYRGYSRDTIQFNLDRKWTYLSNGFLEHRLAEGKSTLFNIRYLNGRRIKYFIATALRILFEQRRDMENPKPVIIVLEEAQNPFNSYSMNDDISQVLTTVFTQSRSDANVHYVVIGQRLNDMSTKIVERLRPLIGYTIGENSLRKVRSQLPKALKKIPQTLEPRTWLYPSAYDNETIESAILRSPTHRAIGKPTRLNPNMYAKPQPQGKMPTFTLKPKPKKKSLLKRILKKLGLLLDFPTPRSYHIEEDKDESEEHTLLAENENEETESLFWD